MSKIKRHKVKAKMLYQTKKKKRISKELIWTLILAGLMIASVFGIMFSGYADGGEKEAYGDYEFIRTNQGWKLVFEDRQFVFQYHPSDIDELVIDPSISDKIRGASVLYITFDPTSKAVEALEVTRFGISMFLTDIQIYPQLGVTKEDENYNQPIVDCYNATNMVPVLKLVETNVTKVHVEGDCIIIEADKYDLQPMVDRLSYAILGVIE